MLIRSIFEH